MMWKTLAEKIFLVKWWRIFWCRNHCWHITDQEKRKPKKEHGVYVVEDQECKLFDMIMCCKCGKEREYNNFQGYIQNLKILKGAQ